MSLKKISILILSICFIQTIDAQFKPQRPTDIEPTNFSAEEFSPAINPSLGIPRNHRTLPTSNLFAPRSISLTSANTYLTVKAVSKQGLPILIQGVLSASKQDLPLEEQVYAYLEEAKSLMQIREPKNEFNITKINKDKHGEFHVHLQQKQGGIPVFSGQIILHTEGGVINSLNGRYFATPNLEQRTPTVSKATATQYAYADIANDFNTYELTNRQKQYTETGDFTPELVIVHQDFNHQKETLCWKIKVIPNVMENWDYFIDAHSGEVIYKTTHSCAFYPAALSKMNGHGEKNCYTTHAHENIAPPLVSSGDDLFGINRNLNVFKQGSTFYLIDGGRNMFNSSSTIPNDARGAIITVDAQNTHPANSSFDAVYIANSSNNWNDPKAVSAHYNAGICYEYYRQNHNRNSINGQGGNILSFINVSETDGNGMDNAFWNGQAMFYGNGNQGFTNPLQKALDVAGHEMTHGVIQATAGLIYESQSGAINESMADIFGHLMEPGDWQLGEDVVNTAIFSSGALRDLSNPNQGGSGLNHAGWQPDHMNEYLSLPNTPDGDNGGVHINSGIINKAFFLFASNIGETKAGEIYYHALANHLTANSQFIDLRLAIIQSANQLYGSTESNAAGSAFDQVGIFGGSGSSDPTDYTSNPGDDFVILTDDDKSALYLYDDGSVFGLTEDAILSRPSITDDGGFILYVAADNTIRVLTYNSDSQSYTEDFLETNPQTIWRNVAISKDGTKLAALTTDYDNTIFIFDFTSGVGQDIEVRNSTSQTGVFTNDLQYVDFIEWDFVGEELLFDAFNELDDDFGNTSDYWDIGLIRAWDNTANTFGDAYVFKIFSGLPENSSVGNPSFSKNSPYIITLDFIDDSGSTTENSILGVNIQTGDVGEIFENAILGYPNYSTDDSQLIFDALNSDNEQVIAIVGLNDDKITANGSAQIFIDGGKWGVWYGLGERDLTAISEGEKNALKFKVFPNPTSGLTTLQLTTASNGQGDITVMNIAGKVLHQQKAALIEGRNNIELQLEAWLPGIYLVKVKTDEGIGVSKVVLK